MASLLCPCAARCRLFVCVSDRACSVSASLFLLCPCAARCRLFVCVSDIEPVLCRPLSSSLQPLIASCPLWSFFGSTLFAAALLHPQCCVRTSDTHRNTLVNSGAPLDLHLLLLFGLTPASLLVLPQCHGVLFDACFACASHALLPMQEYIVAKCEGLNTLSTRSMYRSGRSRTKQRSTIHREFDTHTIAARPFKAIPFFFFCGVHHDLPHCTCQCAPLIFRLSTTLALPVDGLSTDLFPC
jgi:hypothetical protein